MPGGKPPNAFLIALWELPDAFTDICRDVGYAIASRHVASCADSGSILPASWGRT